MNPRSSSCGGKALAPARSLRSHRTYAENTEKLSYCQPDQRFRGAAYEYVRVADSLPSYEQIAEHDDPLCRVKLFQPGSRFTYYACALTNYDGMLVLSGYVLSPLDPDFDAFEDASIAEIAAVRVNGLPPERDLQFGPMSLSALKDVLHAGGIP